MRWELKNRALERGITTSAALRRILADHGLAVSTGKMSGLWSGTPLTIRLQDLEVICTALVCQPSDLLVPQRHPAPHTTPAGSCTPDTADEVAAGRQPGRAEVAARGQLSHEPTTATAGHRQTAPADRRLTGRLVPPL